MPGVEILNQHKEMTSLVILGIAYASVALAILLVRGVYCLCMPDCKKEAIINAVLMAIAIGGLVLLLVVGKRDTVYEVIVSDDVAVNDFYEKYDVRKVEGKIYTVIEKETK